MHFYEATAEGVEPRHYVPLKSRPDELRPTRITDVKKWWREGREVMPSVTTVLNVLNKWALNNWRIDQHLFQAHQLDPSAFGSRESYLAEVKRLTELEMDKAPKAGTDIHTVLEDYARGIVPDDPVELAICKNTNSALFEYTNYQLRQSWWNLETRFVSDVGFGGAADIYNEDWVIDYKSKQTADKFKPGKMAYIDHRMQLAAYRGGLGVPSARCANVFICLETGEIDFHEHSEDDLQHGWEVFRHALAIWQLQNGWEAPL